MGISDTIKGTSASIPKFETLDLLVNGSTPVLVKVLEDFTYISRVILTMRFPTSTLSYSEFGEDTALTNGFYMQYSGATHTTLMGDDAPLKDNGGFFRFGYDVVIQSDAVATPNKILSARWSFDKWNPHGLGMWDGEEFGFVIRDNMTALTSVSELLATVQGWLAHP
jgi:hypothetical protein